MPKGECNFDRSVLDIDITVEYARDIFPPRSSRAVTVLTAQVRAILGNTRKQPLAIALVQNRFSENYKSQLIPFRFLCHCRSRMRIGHRIGHCGFPNLRRERQVVVDIIGYNGLAGQVRRR